MEDALMIAEKAEARKASKRQSDRLRHLDSSAKGWADKSAASCLLLFAWTGRIGVEQAYCRVFGQPFAKLPLSVQNKLSSLIKRLANSEHPGHGDAIKLLEQPYSDDNVVQLDEDTAPGFFEHAIEKRIIGTSQAQELTELWKEFRHTPGRQVQGAVPCC